MNSGIPLRLAAASIWIAALVEAAAGDARAAGIPDARDVRDAPDRPRAVYAGANCDTLDYGWREVLPVAVAELERNRWTIQSADSSSLRVVTQWKPLRHVLARVLVGDVQAKVVVDLLALGPERTLVTIRGGLTSDRDIESTPVFGAAQRSYRAAAERWILGVRKKLDERRAAGPPSAMTTRI